MTPDPPGERRSRGGGPPVVIAIDGPAGSGKSTVAVEVASRLGLERLDTGAMYRAVALEVARLGHDPADGAEVAEVARAISLDPGPPVLVGDRDVSKEIRGPEVTAIVSAVSAHPVVREEMVKRQREWVAVRGGGVVEGRDIGSVVFPDARLKVYLTASSRERGRRRAAQQADGEWGREEQRGRDQDESHLHREALDEREVEVELDRRDRLDASRASSPLTVAEGAVVLDTTGHSVDEVAGQVIALL